ncbi:hypothetical protein SNEBB_004062 [Seison nebaliae]|nr:hypothetical protein SNEBB_004062 [Seison nebaliae]
MDSHAALKSKILSSLKDTGEKERLMDIVRQGLYESGWRDEMRTYCNEIVKKEGFSNLTVDKLVEQITPKARKMVPVELKDKVEKELQNFIDTNTETNVLFQ